MSKLKKLCNLVSEKVLTHQLTEKKERVNVLVKFSGGHSISIGLSEDDLVWALKDRLKDYTGSKIEQQFLHHNGHTLRNAEKLSALQKRDGQIIVRFMLRLAVGSELLVLNPIKSTRDVVEWRLNSLFNKAFIVWEENDRFTFSFNYHSEVYHVAIPYNFNTEAGISAYLDFSDQVMERIYKIGGHLFEHYMASSDRPKLTMRVLSALVKTHFEGKDAGIDLSDMHFHPDYLVEIRKTPKSLIELCLNTVDACDLSDLEKDTGGYRAMVTEIAKTKIPLLSAYSLMGRLNPALFSSGDINFSASLEIYVKELEARAEVSGSALDHEAFGDLRVINILWNESKKEGGADAYDCMQSCLDGWASRGLPDITFSDGRQLTQFLTQLKRHVDLTVARQEPGPTSDPSIPYHLSA